MIVGPSPNGIEFAGKRTTPALAIPRHPSQTPLRRPEDNDAVDLLALKSMINKDPKIQSWHLNLVQAASKRLCKEAVDLH